METSNLQHQAMTTHSSLEEVLSCSKIQQQQQQDKRLMRPQPEQALRCPRCDSTNTKFCYYNNYSLTQPRYFCKGCRRYWTKGGSLRNVPVGGGCRKNKRPCSSSSNINNFKKTQDHQITTTNPNPLLHTLHPPPLTYDPNDLSLAFASLQKSPDNFMLGNNPSSNSVPPQAPGFLDILRTGFLDTSSGSAFSSLYYGFGGNGSVVGDMEGSGGSGVGGEEVVQLPFEGLGGAAATVKQESSCKDFDGDSKVFMGLQWQVGAGGGGNNLVVDGGGRDYWNGVGSSWHNGLVHSSLI